MTPADADEAADQPTLFCALTVNVYCTPLASPVTVHANVEVVHVNPSGVEVTWYELIGEPLLEFGTVHETATSWLPRKPTTLFGTVGTPAGVTASEGDDATELPTPFAATTRKVYEVPFVRPVTVQELVAVVHVFEPGVEVTV
jgi:hypothetical protein